MTKAIAFVALLAAACCTVEESLEQDFTYESHSVDGENEAWSDAVTETEPDISPIEPDQRSGGELVDAKIDSAEAAPPTDQPAVSQAVTLDELLRQTRNTPHLQQEALLARLAERRRLAIAIRSTLEAAEQVAAFGNPGAQLLQDASLDTIVASMIAVQKQKQAEQDQMMPATPQLADPIVTQTADGREDSDTAHGFDGWQPVFVVHDARGHKVGWRHEATGVRTVTYVGKRWVVGEDTVTVEGVDTDVVGRYVIVNVNGERLEIDL